MLNLYTESTNGPRGFQAGPILDKNGEVDLMWRIDSIQLVYSTHIE